MSSQKALTAASTTSSNSSDALAVDITAAASGHNETFCSMLRSRSISSMCVLEDIHDADAKYIYGQCNEGNPFYVDLNRSRTHTYNTSLISDLVHYDKGADRGLSNWKLRCFGGFLGTFPIRSRLWDADRNVRLAVRRALQPGLTVYAREAIRARRDAEKDREVDLEEAAGAAAAAGGGASAAAEEGGAAAAEGSGAAAAEGGVPQVPR